MNDKKPPTSKEITPRGDDFSQWYLDMVLKAELADYGPVKGCMIIRPYGYAIWELMQAEMDRRIKDTGHVNAYFPLFIPKSFFQREEQMAEGFAKECAVVTHHRLKSVDDPARPGKKMIVSDVGRTISSSSSRASGSTSILPSLDLSR